MTPAYPLRFFFDCSTAHLSRASRAYLADQVRLGNRRPKHWVAETPYGWFVWADDEPSDDLPPDLVVIMRHARSYGAEYILFDADAPENTPLPIFDEPD